MKINREQVIRCYHGSQNNNLQLSDSVFYGSDNKELAANFALGYAFNYDLLDGDHPTLYTVDMKMSNPKVCTTEEEYDEFVDIVSSDGQDKLIEMGYDGIIYESNPVYYVVFDAKEQATIVEKESLEQYVEQVKISKNWLRLG